MILTARRFRVGATRDLVRADGSLGLGEAGSLESLGGGSAALDWEPLKRLNRPVSGGLEELTAEQIRGYDALLVLSARITAQTLEGADRLAIVARMGVGYDAVDVPECTRRGVLVTITPDGVRRPVASGAVAFILALGHRLLQRDRAARAGEWENRHGVMGTGLTGRTLGMVGLGNIGREVLRLIAPFGMRHVAYDPYLEPSGDLDELGVQLVGLERLMGESDFVCVTCPLTSSTHHLIGAERLASMKPTSYLVNVARGPIVDQRALTAALEERRIAGAALDVFESEPPDPNDPLLTLDNVILAPHAICWTDECVRGILRSACVSIVDVASGRTPQYVVNREALEHPRWRGILRRAGERAT